MPNIMNGQPSYVQSNTFIFPSQVIISSNCYMLYTFRVRFILKTKKIRSYDTMIAIYF